jgi:hypothetical protein
VRRISPSGFVQFDPGDLLQSLNGKRDYANELEIYGLLGAGLADGLQEDPHEAGKVFIAVLRELVDAWLQSGVGAGGVETPKMRKMAARKPFDSFQQWLFRNPPTPMLTRNGEMKLEIRPANAKVWAGMFNAAFEEARTLFLLLMTSQAKYALFKCSHPGCGVYYILQKPRSVYKLGTVCPEHRAHQGVRRKRSRDQQEALQIAANALAAWPNLSTSTRAKHKNEKHYIASKLKRFGISVKWVSRNLTKIEKCEVSNGA